MDLSKLSTEDLLALKAGDLSKVSTEGLQSLRHAQVSAQIDSDPISQGARNFTDGMGGMEKFNAGVGKAFSDLGLGVRQRLGLAGRDEVKERRRLDAPLMGTGAGVGGNLMGNLAMLAPTAAIPGANTVPAAGAVGGLIGLLQPSASLKEDAFNVGVGATGGAVGQYAANLAGNAVAAQQARNASVVTQNAQKTQAAQKANQAGFVIPPEDIGEGGGVVTRVLSGLGGKTGQVASQRNQQVVNDLARQELGIPSATPLTVQELNNIRNQAGQAYAAVENLGTITPGASYTATLDNIVAPYVRAAKSFPNGKPNPIVQEIDALRSGSFDAADAVAKIKTLRADADAAYGAGNKELGKSLKKGAEALEQAIEDHLTASGGGPLLDAFREARKTIAKTYSVQSGLNTTTGNVAAGALAKQLEKGRPLSGNLLTIAETAQSFPRATQSLKEAPKAMSPLDFAVGGFGAGAGSPIPAMLMAARPAARSLLLSQPMQRQALQAAATPQQANALLRALSQEQLTLPASFAGSNALAAYLGQ